MKQTSIQARDTPCYTIIKRAYDIEYTEYRSLSKTLGFIIQKTGNNAKSLKPYYPL